MEREREREGREGGREGERFTTRSNGEGPPTTDTVQLYWTHKQCLVVRQHIATCNKHGKSQSTNKHKQKQKSLEFFSAANLLRRRRQRVLV